MIKGRILEIFEFCLLDLRDKGRLTQQDVRRIRSKVKVVGHYKKQKNAVESNYDVEAVKLGFRELKSD